MTLEIKEPYVVDSGYLPPTQESYDGDLNYYYQRTGNAEQVWQYTSFQRYRGDFVQDSLHGHGTYTWLQMREKNFLVEGTFYASCFNGYCTVTYSDQMYFEGLLRRNKRFGPGVLTYRDGRQDVGLWNGPHLLRVYYSVFPENLPKLAYSPLGKVKLLRFKKLVSICEEENDLAKEILKKLGASEQVLAGSNQLYNPYIRNLNSLLFDQKLHNEKIYGQTQDCFIDVPASTTDFIETISKGEESIKEEEKLSDIVDYLVENAEVLSQLPQDVRGSFIQTKVIEERPDLMAEMDEGMIADLLNIFLKELDELFKLPAAERHLIIARKTLMKNLPESWNISDIPTKKVAVKEILAWNNGDHSIEMMKYIFKNMGMENKVSFKVRNLLVGNRSDFGTPGDLEQSCIRFLQECCNGNYRVAAEILVENNLNPDVCDAKGNSAVMFSAARDRWRVIKVLSNFGANLDMLNDDGLSALNTCILRYIAFKEDVTDWEEAFLNDTSLTEEEKTEVQQWRPHSSLLNLRASSIATSLEAMMTEEDNVIKNNLLQKESLMEDLHLNMSDKNLKDILEEYCDEITAMHINMEYKDFQKQYEIIPDPKQKYLFEVNLVIPPSAETKRKAAKPKKKETKPKGVSKGSKSTATSVRTNKSKLEMTIDPKDISKKETLQIILTTIKVLLGLGCDPNYCPVPIPTLLMGIYGKSKEIADLLLKSGADPNVTSKFDGLTPLLLLAALPFSEENAELFESLLLKGANPNQKASPNHWKEEKSKLLGKCEPGKEIVDEGKTALHILAMRYDFENDSEDNHKRMVEALINYDANTKESYLGHTPFSIAILRGNIKLIRFYIESKSVEPYALLGEDMGTPLTVLILKRYNNVLPIDKAMEVYDVLTEYNFNPLVEIENVGNAVEFMEREYEAKSSKRGSDKKSKGNKSKGSKKGKKGKKNPVEELKEYLVLKTREMLGRNISAKALKHLRTLIILSADSNLEIIKTLVNFFNLKTVGKFLQLLIDRGILKFNKLNVFFTYQLLNLMDKYSKKKEKNLLIGDIFKSLIWQSTPVDRIKELVEPEIDTKDEIYQVCFNCCQKVNKTLIVCPICGLVYFCSQECNKSSIKQDTIHKCKYLFYDKEKKQMDNCLKMGIPYKPNNRLQDALDSANEDLFSLLKKKYGTNNAIKMMNDAITNGILDIDALLESNEFIQNSLQDALGITQGDVEELSEKLLNTMAVSQVTIGDETKKKKEKSEDGFDTPKRSKIGFDIQEKVGKKKGEKESKSELKGKKGGRGKKGGEVDEDEDEGGKLKKGGKKEKPSKGKTPNEEKSKKSGTKSKTSSSERSSDRGAKEKGKSKEKDKDKTGAKERAAPKSKATPKGKGSITKEKGLDKSKTVSKGKGSVKEKKVTKEKESKTTSKGKGSIKDKESAKEKSKAASKGKESIKDKKSAKGRIKAQKSPTSKTEKSSMSAREVPQVSKATSEKTDEDFRIEDQFSTRQGPLSCIQYVGKKNLEVKTLPPKCQFLLEELARLFPDFDFTGILWPFVIYSDGQLYYRFLDKAPLFIETLSNI